MELLIKLHRPASIELVDVLPPSLSVHGVEYTAGFAPWPTSPDLLYDPDTNALVGAACVISLEHWNIVQGVAASLDAAVVCYNPLTSDEEIRRYGIDPTKSHVLEVVWANVSRVEYLPALMTEDLWYTDKSATGDRSAVAAFGIRHLESVLKEFGLRLPRTFKIPQSG